MAEVENSTMSTMYASNGKGNLGVTLGAIGTGLGLLGGGLGLMGTQGGLSNNYVSKETFDKETEISALNSKIALLEAEKDSESKMIDVYTKITTRLAADEKDYQADKLAQQVWNAGIQSQVAVNTNNIAQLMNMTKLYIPSTNVTPLPMSALNSWTAPTSG